MDAPFLDWETGRNVQGFKHCGAEEQERLLKGNLLAEHVREMAAREAEQAKY